MSNDPWVGGSNPSSMSTCRSVLGQDTDPHIAPNVLVGTLHGYASKSHFNGVEAIINDVGVFILWAFFISHGLFQQYCPV